jgi:hypothetical protein
LSTVIAAVALLMPATGVYAAPDSPLESRGLLTFENGVVAYYPDGDFDDPFSAIPPAPEVQILVDENKNRCELDQSEAGTGLPPDERLAEFFQTGGVNNGWVNGSLGVFSRGGGGNSRGTLCGYINGPEIWGWRFGGFFDFDGDGETDVAATRGLLDIEFKHSPFLVITAKLDGVISGQVYVRSGTSSAIDPPEELVDAVEVQCLGLEGQDNAADNGATDNCAVPVDVLFDELEVSVLFDTGEASIEDGTDHDNFIVNRSKFDLVRVDAVVGCLEQLSTASRTPEIGGFIQAVRLNSSGGGCTEQAGLPLSLDLNIGFNLLFSNAVGVALAAFVEWPIEPVTSELSTSVSWDADEPDWPTCVAEPSAGTPRCFPLLECTGTPLRFCGADDSVDEMTGEPLFACVKDTDCGEFDPAHQSCQLTELQGEFVDMDDDYPDPDMPGQMIMGTPGDQHMCWFAKQSIFLGTSGRNGIDDDCTVGEEGCDDTLEDHNLNLESIYIQGDARGRRN